MKHSIKPTVVVGVDYSETGVLALRRALGFARGGTLHVVHAVENAAWSGVVFAGQSAPLEVSISDATATLASHVEEWLREAREGSNDLRPQIVSHVISGVPADELVQLASDLEADLIVVGTHGRRGVERFLIGSTAERVVRLATCPVLVERPKVRATDSVPRIEPPCPRCLDARRSPVGAELWCAQHRERHGRRHTYHSSDVKPAFPSTHGGLSSIS